MYDGQVQVQCCFTSTETIRTIRDGEPRSATSTFTQLLSSDPPQSSSILVRSFLALGSHLMPQWRARPGHRDNSLYFCLGPPVRSPCLPVSSQTSSTAAAWPVRTDTKDFRKGLCKLQALVYDILQSLQTPGTGLRHSSVSANSRHWFTTFFSLCKLQALVYDILQSLQTPGTGLRHSSVSANSRHWFTTSSKVEEGAGNRCGECGVFADMSVLCSSSWAFQVFGLPVLVSPRTSISVLFWEWSTGTQVVRTLAWPGCQWWRWDRRFRVQIPTWAAPLPGLRLAGGLVRWQKHRTHNKRLL